MADESKSMNDKGSADTSSPRSEPEPLPIWFFVGLILLVYGVLVEVGGMQSPQTTTILAETHPALWWGAIMIVAGAIFLAIGMRARKA